MLVDTAGRMQDNEPLMRALAKVLTLCHVVDCWRILRCSSFAALLGFTWDVVVVFVCFYNLKFTLDAFM